MQTKKYFKWALLLSLGGVLFAGYLSGLKLISGTCAFNEPCPYFLGYPACYFGFGFFLTMAIASLFGYFRKPTLSLIKIIFFVSLIGIIFAGYFVSQEVISVIASKRFVLYGLGLPTCVYGLIFYIIIFVLTARQLSANNPID